MPKTASSNFISSSNYRQLPVQILSLPVTFPLFLTLKIGQKNLRHPAEKSLKTNGETRGRLFFVSCRPRDQRPNTSSLLSPPLGEQALSHTTPQAKKQQNSVTMVPPIRRLPAAPILQVSAIALRRAIDHDRCDSVM